MNNRIPPSPQPSPAQAGKGVFPRPACGERARVRGKFVIHFHDSQLETTMSSTDAPAGFKPKKSVALSGVVAGNTALCTVGRSGNDLHYRGYDILDIADRCEFEEGAYLLVHGKV